MSPRYFAAAALCLSAISLASCGQSEQEVPADPEAVEGLSIENTRMILPAVSGNPAAVYFDLSYEGDSTPTLAAVAVEGAAMTMMHEYGEKDFKVQMIEMEPLELTKGVAVAFEPGGRHVMAMDVSSELSAGGKTEVTFIMASGDKTTVVADIVGAGEER